MTKTKWLVIGMVLGTFGTAAAQVDVTRIIRSFIISNMQQMYNADADFRTCADAGWKHTPECNAIASGIGYAFITKAQEWLNERNAQDAKSTHNVK